MNESKFGQMLRDARLANGYGLRAFCVHFGFDPAIISKLERGRMRPPAREKIEGLAEAVGLSVGSAEWDDFLVQADVEASRIPKEMLSDEEAMDLLPAVFRTIGNGKTDRVRLEKLIELLKRS